MTAGKFLNVKHNNDRLAIYCCPFHIPLYTQTKQTVCYHTVKFTGEWMLWHDYTERDPAAKIYSLIFIYLMTSDENVMTDWSSVLQTINWTKQKHKKISRDEPGNLKQVRGWCGATIREEKHFTIACLGLTTHLQRAAVVQSFKWANHWTDSHMSKCSLTVCNFFLQWTYLPWHGHKQFFL